MQRFGPGTAPVRHSHSYRLLLHLATNLPGAGVYCLFGAMANQLRYPCSHTHFCGTAMLAIFEDSPSEKPAREVCFGLLRHHSSQPSCCWVASGFQSESLAFMPRQ